MQFLPKTFLLLALLPAVSLAQHHGHDKAAAKPSPAVLDLGSVSAETKSQVGAVLTAYVEVKNALVATNGKLARAKAEGLLTALKKVDSEKMSATQRDFYLKLSKDLRSDAEPLSETNDVEPQRKHLGDLSKNVFVLAKGFKPSAQPMYLDYCPMAFDNQGGYWLSEQKSILNPYFGAKMLRCGSVKETL